MTMIIPTAGAGGEVKGIDIDASRKRLAELSQVTLNTSWVAEVLDDLESSHEHYKALLTRHNALRGYDLGYALNHLNLSDEVLKEMSRLTGEKLRAVKQRDALVVERDAIIEESNGYLYMADHAKGEWRKAEAALAKASEEAGQLERRLEMSRNANRVVSQRAIRYREAAEQSERLLEDERKFNVKIDRELVNLRHELEASEAKRLQLLADYVKLFDQNAAEITRLTDELASTKQQLTEFKLKHEQPAAFPWNLYGPNGFFFTSYTASITSKAAAEPATAEAAAV